MDDAIAAWFDSVKSGTTPDREEFLSRYPDVSSEVRRFLANYDSFRERVATPESGRPKSSNSQPEGQSTASFATAVSIAGTRASIDSVTTSARFRELKLFKKGGLGELYRANDESLHRETVVKFVGDVSAADPELLNQFRIEAEITGRLDHPGVVPVYGIGEDWNGKPFYVMRLVKGRELTQAIHDYHSARTADPRGAEARRQLLTLLEHLISVCKTVAYAHDVGIIHCDIKPANIMVGKYGETFVLDWGLAVAFERTATFVANEPTMRVRSGSDSSVSGTRGGTYGYISPEQLSPDMPIVPVCDVYSLGATLYEILTGVPPFNGRDQRVADQIRSGQFSPPRTVLNTIPRRLEAICLKAMSLMPTGRYSTAKLLARDLTNWMRDDELLAAPDRWFHRIGRMARRHLAIAVATVLTTVVIASAAAWTMHQSEKNRYVGQQNELVQSSLNTSLDTFEDLCRPVANGEMNNLGVFRSFADKINAFTTDYLEKFEQNPMMLPHTGRVYELRATISRVLSSDTTKALKYYQQAEKSYQAQLSISDESLAAELRGRLAHLQLNQGLLHIQHEDYDQAEKILLDARESMESLRKQPHQSANLGRDLAEVYHSLGEVNLDREVDVAARDQALQVSQDFFERSAELRKGLLQTAARSDRRSLQRDLARSHGYLGDLYLAQGLVAKAEKSYKESKGLREELYRENRMDPESRFQFARGLGNFGVLERNFRGNLDHAVEVLTQAEELQSGLAKEFSEWEKIHLDLARTQSSLAEVYLWQAIDHSDQAAKDQAAKYVDLSRKAAETAGKIYGPRQRSGDRQSAHGLAWTRVTLAALEQLEGRSEQVRPLAEEARELLINLPGREHALGRSELITFAIACSLLGDVKASYNALNDAADRGENTVVRFEKHGQAGLRALATDPTFGSKFSELCRRVTLSLKSD
ncbi:MAG: serine/threonine-protein kinase [Planctomycetota bacterium]